MSNPSLEIEKVADQNPSLETPVVPIPRVKTIRKNPSSKKRAAPRNPEKPKVEKADSKASWVVLWGAQNGSNRTIIGCERCGARLSFPFKTPVHKAEDAIWAFREDHKGCLESDKPIAEPTKAKPSPWPSGSHRKPH